MSAVLDGPEMKSAVAGARQRDAPVGLLHVVHDVAGPDHQHEVLGDDEDGAVGAQARALDPDRAVLGHAHLARDGGHVEVGELVGIGDRGQIHGCRQGARARARRRRATDQAGSRATSAASAAASGTRHGWPPTALTDSRKRATRSPCFTGTGWRGAGNGLAPEARSAERMRVAGGHDRTSGFPASSRS